MNVGAGITTVPIRVLNQPRVLGNLVTVQSLLRLELETLRVGTVSV